MDINENRNVNTSDARRHICMPYIKGLNKNVRRILNGADLDIVFSIPNKFNSVIKKYKDKVNKLNETELVYRIVKIVIWCTLGAENKLRDI